MQITKLHMHTERDHSQVVCTSSKKDPSKKSAPSFKQRFIRRCVVALIFMMVFCLINFVLLCAYIPYSSWSLISWEAFDKAPYVDTIVTGSSYAERTINPNILDDKLGYTTYNIAVPYQSLHDSFHAIKKAHETRGISRVVLGLRHETLCNDSNERDLKRHAIFTTGYVSDISVVYYLRDMFDTVFDPQYFGKRDSLNYPVLWGYHLRQDAEPLYNLTQRLISSDRIADSVARYCTWHYYGKGYGNYNNTQKSFNKNSGLPFPFGTLSDTHMKTYEDICKYCKENNIELITVVTPYPSFTFTGDKGNYPTMMKPLEKIAETYGSFYIDLNLVKNNKYRLSMKHFHDVEHVNTYGADRATALVTDILSHEDPQARMHELLYTYDQWDECCKSYPAE